MFRDQDVTRVLSLVETASVADCTTLVAVDGLMGAGKSTLTAQVVAAVQDVAVVPGDDFYCPISEADCFRFGPRESYQKYFDWRWLRDSVMVPLRRETRARYRRYDWVSDALTDWRELGPGGIVIVAGVFSTRPELLPYYSVTVFVETPSEQRLARIQIRGYQDMSWISHWKAAEDWYMAYGRPRDNVGLVLDGSSS